MAFYLRKGIRFGPFRFNLSKSGLGISGGVTGLRVGMGPRGTYVHAGRGGLYYRKTLSSSGARSSSRNARRAPSATDAHAVIDSADAHTLTPSSHAELCEELQAHRQRVRWPILVLGGLGLLAAMCVLPATLVGVGLPEPIALGLTWPLAIGLAGWGLWLDQASRTHMLLYELEGEAAEAWERAWNAARALQDAQGLWSVEALADPSERTRHGDAEVAAVRTPVKVRQGPPAWLRANTSLLRLGAGRQTLVFTPDAMLVVESDGAVGALPWIDVEIDATEARVREPGPAPGDAEVVGQTWQHTRKDGQADRRFRDNPPVPICRYGVLHLRSRSGLDERFHVSRPELALALADALRALQHRLDLPATS